MFHGISVYSNVCVSASICAFVVFIGLFFPVCFVLFWFVWHPWYWTPVCLSSHFFTCSNYLSLLGYLVSLLGLPVLSWILEPIIKSPWCARQSPYASFVAPSSLEERCSYTDPEPLLQVYWSIWGHSGLKLLSSIFFFISFLICSFTTCLSDPSWNLLCL